MKRSLIFLSLIVAALFIGPVVSSKGRTLQQGSARPSSNAASIRLAALAAARGEESRRKWDLANAEAAFREARELDPANLEAALGQARIERARFRYAETLNLLKTISVYHPIAPDLLAEYGSLYLAAEEPERAAKYFDDALKQDSSNEAAAIGRIGVDLLNRNYGSAEVRLRESLVRYPKNSRSLVLLARVLMETNRNKEAVAYVEQALSANPYDTEAIYILAFLKAAARKPSEVRTLAQRGLALDPLSPGLRRLLSSYIDGQKGYKQDVPAAAREHYEKGRLLKREGKFAEAVAEFEAALRVEPNYYRSLLALGDEWLRDGDFERAAAAAKIALGVDPDGSGAHLELSYAYAGMQEQARLEIGATDFAATFFRDAPTPVFELTAQVFPDYRSLTRQQRVVIDRTVAPLARFLSRLVAAHARHYLLSFDERLSDFREGGGLEDRTTFDGRYYASVRGVGGRITVSGIEYLDMAAHGGANIVAHEFAHQVHITALSPDDVKFIRKLYERAVREGATLDFYAAADEYEYFAQGYEAFISTGKRPSASVTARHTSKELLDRDPLLYQFFLKQAESARLATKTMVRALPACMYINHLRSFDHDGASMTAAAR